MTAIVWAEAPIAKRHDRAAFDCGDPDLNLYLQRFARQNHESGGAKCFVAVPSDAPARILGFYTLSPASIEYSARPLSRRKVSAVTRCLCFASAGSPLIERRNARGSAALSCCVRPTAASASPMMSTASLC